jgi:hypothetical protein
LPPSGGIPELGVVEPADIGNVWIATEATPLLVNALDCIATLLSPRNKATTRSQAPGFELPRFQKRAKSIQRGHSYRVNLHRAERVSNHAGDLPEPDIVLKSLNEDVSLDSVELAHLTNFTLSMGT